MMWILQTFPSAGVNKYSHDEERGHHLIFETTKYKVRPIAYRELYLWDVTSLNKENSNFDVKFWVLQSLEIVRLAKVIATFRSLIVAKLSWTFWDS